MPEEYQGESEDSTASKKERLKIKKKKEERDAPPVRRGLKNPNFKKQPMRIPKNPLMHLDVPLRPEEQAKKDAFKRELKKKPEKKNKKKPLKMPLKIQGRGPSDPKERAAWLRAGNTPYGITRTTPKK